MMGGLNFIAVLIGLFAIPEITEHGLEPDSHMTASHAVSARTG